MKPRVKKFRSLAKSRCSPKSAKVATGENRLLHPRRTLRRAGFSSRSPGRCGSNSLEGTIDLNPPTKKSGTNHRSGFLSERAAAKLVTVRRCDSPRRKETRPGRRRDG